MTKFTCEGKFHTPFRKSRRLRSLVSLYGSDSASEWAHEHQHHLLFSLSGLIHSGISFSWQEVPRGSCWHLKVKSLFVSTAFPGDGTWHFSHPFSPTVEQSVIKYWVTTGVFLLFYQQVTLKPPAFVFRSSPIDAHAQVGTESTPQGFVWCLPNLYSQIALKLTRLFQMKEWARLTFAFHQVPGDLNREQINDIKLRYFWDKWL